jgi:hypothetical protein
VLSWPDTLNPYPYALNNLVNLVDPSGEFTFITSLTAGLIGGFLGGVGYYTLQAYLNAALTPLPQSDFSLKRMRLVRSAT